MSAPSHPDHDEEELCSKGEELYEQALREGYVRNENTAGAPCLVTSGLLQPSIEDPGQLEPVDPVTALRRLLLGIENRISHERRREERLTALFDSLIRLGTDAPAVVDDPTITVLSGSEQINKAITEAMAKASRELLSIQPHTGYRGRVAASEAAHAIALARDQALLDRGCRIRTLYQHTLRYAPLVIARYEQLKGNAEARTLDEITDRLIVVDGEVAFVSGNREGSTALAVRQPVLVGYFVTFFDRLWRLATPMRPDAVQHPSAHGVTPRQRAIATLLVEGHTDAVIADRLGLNIRTARVHIAKLASLLGSESRAQLGYLIAESGFLKQEDTEH